MCPMPAVTVTSSLSQLHFRKLLDIRLGKKRPQKSFKIDRKSTLKIGCLILVGGIFPAVKFPPWWAVPVYFLSRIISRDRTISSHGCGVRIHEVTSCRVGVRLQYVICMYVHVRMACFMWSMPAVSVTSMTTLHASALDVADAYRNRHFITSTTTF